MKKRHILGLVIILLVVGLGISWVMLSHPRPVGKAGPAADALAKKMQKAAGIQAWAKIGAVSWVFGGRNTHLWDRRRMLSRVRWGRGTRAYDVLFHIGDPKKGIVRRAGALMDGQVKAKALKRAYSFWCNDSFWLNPIDKLFDKGVTRKRVKRDGKEHLLIEFASGGVTPGDAYFFVLGDKGLPTHWHMYVQIIPIQGLKATFEGWSRHTFGAQLSSTHKIAFFKLQLKRIKTAKTLQELVGSDVFAPLFGGKAGAAARRAAPRATPRAAPTSRPAAPAQPKAPGRGKAPARPKASTGTKAAGRPAAPRAPKAPKKSTPRTPAP